MVEQARLNIPILRPIEPPVLMIKDLPRGEALSAQQVFWRTGLQDPAHPLYGISQEEFDKFMAEFDHSEGKRLACDSGLSGLDMFNIGSKAAPARQ